MKKLVCMLLFALVAQSAFGGTTGKIAGRIVDGSTGEKLPGANITVEGTNLGAVSNLDGNYFIINVPVGTYTVRASLVGYAGKAVSGVKVIVDMTSTLDFTLSTHDIQTAEVVVSASRPAIQQDRTSTKHTIEREVIDALPVDDFRQVVQVQAGVSGSHFRGGRYNESTFLVDGLQIKTAINGYTEYTGGFSANIPQINVDEVQVSTGGFEAEYGNAQSGIVNTLTRNATSAFSAKVRARTSDFPWAKMQLKPNQYGSGLPDWKDFEAFVSTPSLLSGDMRLAMTASADVSWQNRGFLTNQTSRAQSYQGKMLFSSGPTKITLNGLYSFSTSTGYNHYYSYFGPLSDGYQADTYLRVAGTTADPILERYFYVSNPIGLPSPTVRTVTPGITYNGVTYTSVRDIYQVGMQQHQAVPKSTNFDIGATWNQTLNKQSFLDVKLSEFYNRWHNTVLDVQDRNHNGDVNEELNWRDNSGVLFPVYGYQDIADIDGYWNYNGDQGRWYDQVARTYSLRADYTNQFSQTNLLKVGAEVNYSTGDMQKITFESATNPRLDIWSEDLIEYAVYAQDKIEVRDGFILNAGVRLDYYNPNGLGDPVLFPANPLDLGNPVRRLNLTSADKVPSQWQISPRIGIAHPITERDKLHFYYGHFFQRPDFRFLYENATLDFRYSTNVDVGNPRLAPEKTVSYEIGWEHLFTDNLRFGVTGYYKDITNLVEAADFAVIGTSQNYQVYQNQDYANVRGLEFTLETLGQVPIGGMINYTYAYANGRSSSSFKGNTEVIPRRLDPLNWDVRHRINANIILRSFGAVEKVLGDAELAILATARSGVPYTTNTRDVFPLFTLRNDGRLPWSKNVDLRFRKTWRLTTMSLSLLAEVYNLFNWRNVTYIYSDRESLVQFEATGDPGGPFHDPTTYSQPRVYRLGVEFQL
ncbi:MAG TPA: TonB-dependent receptor [Bacteroidota bacterium]